MDFWCIPRLWYDGACVSIALSEHHGPVRTACALSYCVVRTVLQRRPNCHIRIPYFLQQFSGSPECAVASFSSNTTHCQSTGLLRNCTTSSWPRQRHELCDAIAGPSFVDRQALFYFSRETENRRRLTHHFCQ